MTQSINEECALRSCRDKRELECDLQLEVHLPLAFSLTSPLRLRYQSTCGLALIFEFKVSHESYVIYLIF
jgi:hypothetical protein